MSIPEQKGEYMNVSRSVCQKQEFCTFLQGTECVVHSDTFSYEILQRGSHKKK